MLEIVHQSVLAKSWFSLTMLDLSLWSRCFTGRNLWKLECMFKQKIHIKCQLPIWRLQFQFPTFSFRWREWTGNNPHNKEHHQLNPGCNSINRMLNLGYAEFSPRHKSYSFTSRVHATKNPDSVTNNFVVVCDCACRFWEEFEPRCGRMMLRSFWRCRLDFLQFAFVTHESQLLSTMINWWNFGENFPPTCWVTLYNTSCSERPCSVFCGKQKNLRRNFMAGEYVPIQDQGCDTKDDGSGTLKQFETSSFPACFFHMLAMLGCPE